MSGHPAIAGLRLVLGGNVFGMTADRDASFAVLDTFYEVIYTREVATLEEACAEARFALSVEKSASSGR